MPGRAGHFFQHGTDRLGDQLQPGQVTHRGQDMRGIGALRGAFTHQSGVLHAGQGEIEEAVGAVALDETLAEVAQDTVMEAGIVQLQGQGVFEVDAAAHRLGGLPVGQTEQELQHANGGQLGRREAGAPVAGIPVGEVLVAPQPVQPVPYPHSRRTARVVARATCAVREGTSSPERGRSDNEHLDNYIGHQNSPEHDRWSPPPPGNTKITDRVKLRPRP